MMNWTRSESGPSRYFKGLDLDEFQDQLDGLKSSLRDITNSFGKVANWQWDRTRNLASSTADDAEELMKDHLAASLLVALGVGIVVGYMIRRGK